jgi:hypothetical protein
MTRFTALIATLLLVGSAGIAVADDVADAIKDAEKAYKSGDLIGAKQSLDLASQLISQKNSEGLVRVFPAPLQGRTSEKADTSMSSFAAFGGSNATRRYTNKQDDDVSISITADSPALAQMIALFSNPQMAGMMGKVVMVNGHRAVQEKQGNITIVVVGQFMIKVDGSAKAEDKLAYAKAIDIKTLEGMK